MKKLLLIIALVGGFMFVGAPKSEAGISVGFGFGGPVGYGYNPYGYGSPYYSSCAYPGYYPYRYSRGYYARPYYRVGYRPYHRRHGRRVYYARRFR